MLAYDAKLEFSKTKTIPRSIITYKNIVVRKIKSYM